MKKHLKRLTIPTTWPVMKKGVKFISRPLPSKPMDMSVPLVVVFRDMLKMGKIAKEVKHLLNNNYIFVNGVRKTDIKQTLGLLETLEIKGTSESYRLLLNENGKFFLKAIKEEEVKLCPFKIVGKTILMKGKMQINLLGGMNILSDKKEYKIGDMILVDVSTKKIKDHFPLAKGSFIYIIGGNYIGKTGTVEEIDGEAITLKSGSKQYKTLKEYAFVIGKTKPAITIQ